MGRRLGHWCGAWWGDSEKGRVDLTAGLVLRSMIFRDVYENKKE